MTDLYNEILINIKNNSKLFINKITSECADIYIKNFPLNIDNDDFLDLYSKDIADCIYDHDFQFNDSKHLIRLLKSKSKLIEYIISYYVNQVLDYDEIEDSDKITTKKIIDDLKVIPIN